MTDDTTDLERTRLEQALEYLLTHIGQGYIDSAPQEIKTYLHLVKARARARIAAREFNDATQELNNIESKLRNEAPLIEFPLVSKWVEELECSVRTASVLKQEFGSKTLLELATLTADDVLSVPNSSRRCLNDLKRHLAMRGLDLGMSEEDARRSYRPPPQ